MKRAITIAMLAMAACQSPSMPVPEQPITCPAGSYADFFTHQCKRYEPQARKSTSQQTRGEPSGPRIGISSRGRLGINSNKGMGLHIDHRGRVGLGWGL